jgi:ribosome biogenesis protein MAK21
MSAQHAISDRFYGALYAALLRPGLPRSAALPAFLSLVFQAVKADVSPRRAAAFVKRLLQVTMATQASVTCGVLLLVSELFKAQPALWPAVLHAEDAPAAGEARDVPKEDVQAAVATGGTAAAAAWPAPEYYDMAKRAPQHARAERACAWELSVLSRHVHPSVSAMARTLLAGASVMYEGDPLRDLTLAAFLDKFVRRCAPRRLRPLQPRHAVEGSVA